MKGETMPGGTVNVLLVEDNEVDVEAVERAFQEHRIVNPITVARDGREALEALRSGTVERPYLILLDLNLPRMDGIEFLEALRADPTLQDSIVLVLTTSNRDEDKIASYKLNVAGYILKSEVGDGLLKLTKMLDRFWRVVEFPPDRE